MRALACPGSLKGVLGAADAAAAIAAGVAGVAGWEAEALAVADGGEGTAEVLERALGGRWQLTQVRDPLGRPVDARILMLPRAVAVVEAAEAIGLGLVDPLQRDPLVASSAGLGDLLAAALSLAPSAVLVALGGTATVDGGAGLLAALERWPASLPLTVACDVRSPLLGARGAARVFAAQKGAGPAVIDELERRLAAMERLAPYRELPGAGAGGGIGAALAVLGGTLREGAPFVLDAIGFDRRAAGADLVITGEGTVDASSFEGKAPGVITERCARLGLRCALFGGRVEGDYEARALSGDPSRVVRDLRALGEQLARELG